MTGKEANMNIDTLFRVKNEPFEPPFDIYSMDCRNSCYSAFTDLSNWRSFGCTECNDRIDYECSSCMCQICFHKTSAEKRYRCFQCHKVFHEWCRTNREMASSTGRWLCLKCKDLENRHSSFFRPCIKEVITKVPDGKSRMVVIKSEKFDLNSNSTVNESLEVDPVLENSLIQAKNKIVERVAKSFMRKMNNAARNKICVIVPSNHFGPIPGILVGTCWKYRLQVSESGVHRPLVAGIHGRENEGAYSIVLSGVYAEDQDNGDVFYYSGCGGRDKDPTKRCSAQVQDQKLTRYNKALAVSCNAPLNDEIGAEAVDWRAGKPVRVIRNYKLKKHSIYAPEEGNRYDGIYKVVKYFPTVGKAGLLVWRYFLRRDDPEPAPWTEAGKRIIEEKNLRVIWPDESENEDTFSTSINEEIERPIKKQRPYNDNNYQFPDMNAFDVKYIKSEMGLPTPILDLRLTTDNLDDTSVDIKPDINLLQLSLQQGAHARVSPYSSFSGSYTVSSAPTESVPMFKITVASVKSVNSNHFISSNAQNVANGKNFVRDGDRDSRALDSRHSAAGDIRVSVTPGSKNLTASGNNVSRIFDSKDPAPGDNKVLGTPDIKDLPAGSNKVSGTPNSKDPAAGGNKVSGIPDIKDPASGSNKITRTPKIKDPATGSSKVLGTLDNKDPAAGGNKVSGIPDNRIPAVDGIKVLGTSDGKNPAAGDIEISRIFDCKSSAADNEKISWTPDKRNNFATVDNRVSGTPESLKNISPMSLISIKEEKGGHELPENVKKFMEMDTFNKTVWDFCGTYLRRSEVEFLNIVKLMFTCRYCCKLVDCPVTTPCDHNVCLECITNHFSKKLYSCPDCHYYLGPLFRIKENINLANALESLFPGYNLKLSKLI